MRNHARPIVDVAVDLTPILYYGNPNSPFLSRMKPDRGTSHGYVFAAASIAERGFRPVIALVLSCLPIQERIDET
jgi:hypothetical protein